MYLKFFLILLVLIWSKLALGQVEKLEKSRGITLGLGLRTFLVNDEVGSNLNYRGSAFSLHVRHDVLTDKQSRVFGVFMAAPNISNQFNANIMKGVVLSVNYDWRFRIRLKMPWDMAWYLGPHVKVSVFARTFQFETNGVEITTGDVFGTIGVSSMMRKNLKKEKYLLFSFRAPIATYMINREFIGSSTQEWMFPDRFADYQVRLAWFGKTLKSAEWMLAYQYQVVIIDRATRVGYEGHLFETGLRFTF